MDRRRTNIFYRFRSKGVRGKRKTTKAVEKKSETQLGIKVNGRNKEIMSIERSRKQN